jgi:protein-S-isoprenylcysteine O-methyltransferase Ste14
MSLSILWKVFYYGWVASEVYIAIATRTRRSSGNVRDQGTMLLLWVVIFCSIFAGTWLAETHASNLPGGALWLKPIALAVLIAGLALRWAAIVSLGKSFSSNVAIHTTQRVLKTGLYRWMRHPSYSGLILIFIAAGLHTRNWIAFLIVTLPTTAALLYRIHVEEIALRDHFGQEYIDYSRQTSRLLPGIY